MFQPRMQNSIEGFSVMGGLRRKTWHGIVADLWDVECADYAGGHYLARDPRLFILLDHSGTGRPLVRQSPRESGAWQDRALTPLSYIPAHMDLWLDISNVSTLRHLDLHFDADIIAQRLGEDIDRDRLDTPRLLFSDERILALSRLIATDIASDAPLHDLYGDGLALSLLIDVLQVTKTPARKRGGLTQAQLRRAEDFITTHCTRTIRLQELAALTGLSASHFSHSFKVSTGMAPQDWQIAARIDRAKHLLQKSGQPLAEISTDVGFSDQAHFTRAFRRHTGTTPGKWRKARQ